LLISTKMKTEYKEFVGIPENVECNFMNQTLVCKKEGKSFSRKIEISGANFKVNDKKIEISCKKANKKIIKIIKSNIAHIFNGFRGLEKDFIYKLEICHVHFPMTVKVEGDTVVISNFLGEKTLRTAKILENVNVNIKGKEITVSGQNISDVGQTAANIEKATKVKGKDRRIFQDGIFMTEKHGRKI